MTPYGLATVDWHLELVSGPASEPVSLAFVRDDHLRVTNGTAEDAWITTAIKTARRMAERATRRALIDQTWQQVMSGFPCGTFETVKSPLIEIGTISYIDTAGISQTLATSAYQVSAPIGPNAARGRVAPAYNTVWPSTRDVLEAVTVEYRAGYVRPGSPETSDVPDEIVSGMLLVIGELYKQRTLSVHSVQNSRAVLAANALWRPYRPEAA
jgi:uncharacterized phiE125 gp8 family phage protein